MSTIIFLLLVTIGVPLFSALCTSFIGNIAQEEMVNNWGFHSQQWLGGLGVIIHELGHLIVALLFDHHISGFKLLRLRQLKDYDTLGYVSHRWNTHNWYESMGNFLIGIAPFYSCSLFLYLCQKLMFKQKMNFLGRPAVSTNYCSYVAQNLWFNVKLLWGRMFHAPLFLIIFLLISIFISMCGFSLSHADKNDMWHGIIPWSLVWLIFAFILSMWNTNPAGFNYYIWKLLIFTIFLAINSISYTLISICITKGIRHISQSSAIRIKLKHLL